MASSLSASSGWAPKPVIARHASAAQSWTASSVESAAACTRGRQADDVRRAEAVAEAVMARRAAGRRSDRAAREVSCLSGTARVASNICAGDGRAVSYQTGLMVRTVPANLVLMSRCLGGVDGLSCQRKGGEGEQCAVQHGQVSRRKLRNLCQRSEQQISLQAVSTRRRWPPHCRLT